ncbi:substrate-binding periplasmic protein [Pigmentibacter ruber]
MDISTLNPFHTMMKKKRKDTGIILEFLKEKILTFRNKKVLFQQYPLSRVLTELSLNKIDAIAFLAKTKEREKNFNYTKTPIYTSNSFITFLKNSPINYIKSIEDIKNETIGIGQHAALCDFLEKNREQLTFEESSAENYNIVLINKLLFKRISAAYTYLPDSLFYEAKKSNTLNQLKFIKIPESSVSVYFVLSKNFNRKEQELIEKNLKNNHLIYKPEFN